jgi:hypothetical protein
MNKKQTIKYLKSQIIGWNHVAETRKLSDIEIGQVRSYREILSLMESTEL